VLHRQSVILLGDAGIDISHATIDGWMMRVGELLISLVGAMRKELLKSTSACSIIRYRFALVMYSLRRDRWLWSLDVG
jgi:hypothetical protein